MWWRHLLSSSPLPQRAAAEALNKRVHNAIAAIGSPTHYVDKFIIPTA